MYHFKMPFLKRLKMRQIEKIKTKENIVRYGYKRLQKIHFH